MPILDVCVDALVALSPGGLPVGQLAISKFLKGYASDAATQTKALRLLQVTFFMNDDGSAISAKVHKAIARRIRVLRLAGTV